MELTDKIKVNKEIATILDEILLGNPTFQDLVSKHLSGWVSEENVPLNNLSLIELTTAYLIGYEIKNEGEEKEVKIVI